MKLTKRNFFEFLIILHVILIIIYLFTHVIGAYNGGVQKYLSKDDVSFILNLDSDKKPEPIIAYIDHKYGFINSAYAKDQQDLVIKVGVPNYIKIISSAGFSSKSFFWLIGDKAIIELIFWSLFGTFCSFLYYYAESKKKNNVNILEFNSYIAKIFYAPFVTLIIYLMPAIFSSENTVLSGSGQWIIVFAFILGFFSGRAIELLDKIKNLIFPYNNQNQDTPDTDSTPAIKNSGSNTADIPPAIIQEAIDKNLANWTHLYGPFESVSTGYKNIDGLPGNIRCIHFDVEVKPDDVTQISATKIIPAVFSYLASDGKVYQIPTDVNQVGTTTPDYDSSQPMSIGNTEDPKCLGLSCSRVSSNNAGTLGLRVVKQNAPNIYYLLSCFHVFADPEVKAGKIRVNSTADLVQAATIISPGLLDGQNDPANGTIALADMTEGLLDEGLDIGIALLKTNFNDSIYRTSVRPDPKKILSITSVHEEEHYPLKIVGRTSGKQNGTVVSAYTSVTITYKGISNPMTFNGVVKTTKMSTEGDSGAAVYDEQQNIVGILFASNNTYSYVLPIIKILSKLNLQIA